ncbi:MAG: tripartite tricarboxylate transporter substrate-binding protein, partial [Patescibacteria group bacterium]
MFWKKVDTNINTDQTISVQTIPADFYGGVNPVVKFKKVEREVVLESKPELTAPEKKMFDKSTAAGGDSATPRHSSNPRSVATPPIPAANPGIGGTSIAARLVSQKLTESMGQPVIVDNRPGANTIIGSEA